MCVAACGHTRAHSYDLCVEWQLSSEVFGFLVMLLEFLYEPLRESVQLRAN